MPRIARVVAVGYPHHITQRGNYRQNIFIDNADRKKYLTLLSEESNRYGLAILAYCLMSNHVHLLGIPEQEDSLGNVFKYVNMKYSQYINRKKGISGHLFQGRFFSSVMDELHTLACARYIERNPVRAKITKRPWEWQWSSANIHCGKEKKDILKVNRFFEYMGTEREGWCDFIEEEEDPVEITGIREKTRTGRPLGEEGFIKKLEKKLNLSLQLKPRGRPKRNKK